MVVRALLVPRALVVRVALAVRAERQVAPVVARARRAPQAPPERLVRAVLALTLATRAELD